MTTHNANHLNNTNIINTHTVVQTKDIVDEKDIANGKDIACSIREVSRDTGDINDIAVENEDIAEIAGNVVVVDEERTSRRGQEPQEAQKGKLVHRTYNAQGRHS